PDRRAGLLRNEWSRPRWRALDELRLEGGRRRAPRARPAVRASRVGLRRDGDPDRPGRSDWWARRRNVRPALAGALGNPVKMETWQSRAKVEEYLTRIGGLPARIAGEGALVELLPAAPASVLDLGC